MRPTKPLAYISEQGMTGLVNVADESMNRPRRRSIIPTTSDGAQRIPVSTQKTATLFATVATASGEVRNVKITGILRSGSWDKKDSTCLLLEVIPIAKETVK